MSGRKSFRTPAKMVSKTPEARRIRFPDRFCLLPRRRLDEKRSGNRRPRANTAIPDRFCAVGPISDNQMARARRAAAIARADAVTICDWGRTTATARKLPTRK
jgi:hypothetical protein